MWSTISQAFKGFLGWCAVSEPLQTFLSPCASFIMNPDSRLPGCRISCSCQLLQDNCALTAILIFFDGIPLMAPRGILDLHRSVSSRQHRSRNASAALLSPSLNQSLHKSTPSFAALLETPPCATHTKHYDIFFCRGYTALFTAQYRTACSASAPQTPR